MTDDPGGAGGARSVERALALLQQITGSPSGMTLSEASRAVTLPTSTVARLLRTLEHTNFLQRDHAGNYTAGTKILQVGAIALGSLEIYKLAEPHLVALSDFTGETAYLAVPDGPGRAIYLRQVESVRAIRHASWTGQAIQTAGSALGSALNDDCGDSGFATSRDDPVEPEAAAAAAPVTDGTGRIIAALSVIGPSFRISHDDLIAFGARVCEEADRLSRSLAGGAVTTAHGGRS